MALINVHFAQFLVNGVKFVRSQADLQCAEVFRQTVFFGCPRNRYDEIPLRQFPRQHDLRSGELVQQVQHRLVLKVLMV